MSIPNSNKSTPPGVISTKRRLTRHRISNRHIEALMASARQGDTAGGPRRRLIARGLPMNLLGLAEPARNVTALARYRGTLSSGSDSAGEGLPSSCRGHTTTPPMRQRGARGARAAAAASSLLSHSGCRRRAGRRWIGSGEQAARLPRRYESGVPASGADRRTRRLPPTAEPPAGDRTQRATV